ncbi:tyrosine-protein kinase SYK [Lingula anatina]|uniref:Tyrosine-protein kinase n=1 Tax=Lingula anatina TaxID=7574 RepID=A0A1S3IIJ0_LINAN|nr:tyrosine-protein kinase SYK [Lingula anatina]XP_013398055.1 tyrosine-protein kinase SYK [Lingula anatina]XP_013398056.1 tyrosine-protein kinase SYK [Lingula anatina]XP_013398057.1 tyrosine-protein kinase SYK [Lingula anatina]|eukprot:XP_013398054.1 tyrosine-protein kinase SYK [Lingula anatina]
MAGVSIPPGTMSYFWGRITREEATTVLRQAGCRDGMYLLRESVNKHGNYALSLCFRDEVHHYNIERQLDGKYQIPDGKKFSGPVELIQHHKTFLDGLLCLPSIPVERGNRPLMVFRGVTQTEFDQVLLKKVSEMGLKGDALANALGPQRFQLFNVVAKDLHKDQCWFHNNIEREEAENRLRNAGHRNGLFLVRAKAGSQGFAMTVSFNNAAKHYKLDLHPSGQLAIEDGPKFNSVMELVDHYYNRADGLLCQLREPCTRPDYRKKNVGATNMDDSPAYWTVPANESEQLYASAEPNGLPEASAGPLPRRNPHSPLPAPPPSEVAPPPRGHSSSNAPLRLPTPKSGPRSPASAAQRSPSRVNHAAMGIAAVHIGGTWDEPEMPERNAPPPPETPNVAEERQKIYDSVPISEEIFNLDITHLKLDEDLGSGAFGAVKKGRYTPPIRGHGYGNAAEIPVAVKTLKANDIPNAREDILKEARIMADLKHKNIVRLIGVSQGETIMLVMELAPLGQLNKFLKGHSIRSFPMNKVMTIMHQVALGMEYLESVRFVHRDLAARNVLLAHEGFAKISDFGMSKAVGANNEYYKAAAAGKWPLKWYAPECIYYFKFDSKSDVWSYGVTLWEATSYGQKPYRGKKGQDILQMIEANQRLEKPPDCPQEIYDIMSLCWKYKKKDRPTFKDLVQKVKPFRH